MANIFHPPLELGLSAAVSAERLFAEEAFQLLTTFAVKGSMTIDSTYMTYPITDRCDVQAADDAERALRLQGVPVLGGAAVGESLSPSDKYYVIEVEHGVLADPEEDMAWDEDYDWEPYVMAVIDTENIDNVSVLDANTGKDLDPADLQQALFTLQFMRNEFRNAYFEEEVEDTIIAPNFERLEQGYGEYDSSEHLELSACDTCGTENVPCAHNSFTLN